jgi:hypothetical protein
MARARRAKPRRSRALIGLLVVALLAGGVVAALRFWPGSLTAISSGPSPTAVLTPAETEPSSATSPSPAPTEPVESSAAARPASEQAVQAMESCRERVRAADEVLEQAQTGIGHWAAHVGAERDAQAGRISVEDRQAIFKATRLQGPADQKRYADALAAYDRVRDASCDEVDEADEADEEVTATLASCQQRASAQAPVLKAAAGAMGDWKSHLAAMQRSREVHVADAQEVWLDAYRAAPKNLDAYDEAKREFDAPDC